MNTLSVILTTILLAIGVTFIGISSAAIAKSKKEEIKHVDYWYSILGLSIAEVLVSVFFLMGMSVMFMSRDTYLE